jgi:hypothetical protein
MGKLAHCLPVMARPRLPGSTGPIPEALASVQVAINDVARSVVGHRREDHIPIEDLLEAAKFLSLNQQVVQATAMAAWNAHVSDNGVDGTRNPVGNLMFGNGNVPTTRPTRATAGEVRVLTWGMDTLVTHALETWSTCVELRDSQVKGRDQPGGKKHCKKIPAVRQSFFGHLELCNSLRDGDKPGIFFWRSTCPFFLWRKSEVNATI